MRPPYSYERVVADSANIRKLPPRESSAWWEAYFRAEDLKESLVTSTDCTRLGLLRSYRRELIAAGRAEFWGTTGVLLRLSGDREQVLAAANVKYTINDGGCSHHSLAEVVLGKQLIFAAE